MTAAFRHRAFGWSIASDLVLPAPAEPDPLRAPDVTVRLGRLLDPPQGDTDVATLSAALQLHFRGPDRWDVHTYASDRAQRFAAGVGPGHIEIAWTHGVEAADVASLLVGIVSVAHAYVSGRACLHGSAVLIDGRAALILGPSGRGKSSLTAAMVKCGARLVSEEVVVLGPDPLSVAAGVPAIKLSAGAAQALGFADEARPAYAHAEFAHEGLRVDLDEAGFCIGGAEIGAVYLLEQRHDGAAPVVSRPLPAAEAVRALAGTGYWMEHLPLPARAGVMRAALDIGRRRPVHLLSLPDDLATLPTAAKSLLGRR